MDTDAQKAISSALAGNWKEAIAINLKILKKEPKNIDALCRLARAYFETGFKTKAEETYKKVLRIDKFNSIATKNMGLLKTSRFPRTQPHKNTASSAPPAEFLEEPGITKSISLARLGDPKIVSRLHPGDPVHVVARQHIVSVTSLTGNYIGRLPDDMASRLLPLLKAGNKYRAWVKSVSDGVRIFIKETSRCEAYAHVPSFPVTEKLTYAAFTPPELVHAEKPDVFLEAEAQEDLLAKEEQLVESELENPQPEPRHEDI